MPTPPIGSTVPGDLYVDLATRTLWLGVDTAVDPAGAVLVSDINSIAPAIAAGVASANSFTTTGLAGKANTVHTHTASQITDFTAAVNAIIAGAGGGSSFTHGMVMQYSGPLSDIGVGSLANWALCDGTNGTPNLKDKFVLGAGNVPPGTTNTGANLSMTTAGAHVHTVNGHVLTVGEMPNHAHTATLGGSGSGSTSVDGNHQHTMLGTSGTSTPPGFVTMAGNSNNVNRVTEVAGNHGHSVTVSVTVSGSVDANGGNGAHDHTMSTAGDHVHVVTPTNIKDAIPFYALAFIMRL